MMTQAKLAIIKRYKIQTKTPSQRERREKREERREKREERREKREERREKREERREKREREREPYIQATSAAVSFFYQPCNTRTTKTQDKDGVLLPSSCGSIQKCCKD
jgi:hypothetical protein